MLFKQSRRVGFSPPMETGYLIPSIYPPGKQQEVQPRRLEAHEGIHEEEEISHHVSRLAKKEESLLF
jgi:hypothetical protein